MRSRRFLEYGLFIMMFSTSILLLFVVTQFFYDLIIFLFASDGLDFVQNLCDQALDGNLTSLIFLFCLLLFSSGFLLILLYLLIAFFSRMFPKANLIEIDPSVIKTFSKKGIIIVIPAYNEESTIGNVIKQCKEYGEKIIVVDDGSVDDTAKIANNLATEVLSHPRNLGLGQTMKDGINKAFEYNPEIIVTIDADDQYDPQEIKKLVFLIREKKADLALGSRFKGKIETMPIVKRIGNISMSWAISFITGQKITDGQTGFRAISAPLARDLKLRGEYTYTQEMIIQAKIKNYYILETPILFKKRISGTSRLITSAPDYALKAWLTILRTYRDYNPIVFFGIMGVIFFIFGLFSFTINLLPLEGIRGSIELTILSMIALSVGAQVILFAFFADMMKWKI